jgi:hypothetical protein
MPCSPVARRKSLPRAPPRAQIEPAALALLARHSAGLLATARRYSACPEDAEDAYQRGVEILLTKAPATTEAELLPWLKTVVIRTFGRLAPLLLLCMGSSTYCLTPGAPPVRNLAPRRLTHQIGDPSQGT